MGRVMKRSSRLGRLTANWWGVASLLCSAGPGAERELGVLI